MRHHPLTLPQKTYNITYIKVKRFFLVITFIFIFACGTKTTTSRKNYTIRHFKASPVYVENNELFVGSYHLLLRGANVSESFKYRRKDSYDTFFGKVTEEDMRDLRENWGFNFARMIFEWYAFEPTEGVWDYTYLKNYAKRVSWAAENNIFVWVDMHMDLYGEGFKANGAPAWTCNSQYYIDARKHWLPEWWMNYAQPGIIACYDHLWTSRDYLWKHFAMTWQKAAEYFSNNPDVIGFEFLNEPFPGSFGNTTFEKEVLYPLYVTVGRAIRKVAPFKILIFEPSVLRQELPTDLSPLPFDQLIYAPHYYDQSVHEGQSYKRSKKGEYLGVMEAKLGDAKYQNAAFVLGEFGAWGPDLVSHAWYLDDLLSVLDCLKAGSAFWDSDFLLKYEKSFPPEFIHSVARAYPEMWKGNISFSYDYKKVSIGINWEAQKGDDALITLPYLSFQQSVTAEVPEGVKWEWLNKYQVRIEAEKRGEFKIKFSKNR